MVMICGGDGGSVVVMVSDMGLVMVVAADPFTAVANTCKSKKNKLVDLN